MVFGSDINRRIIFFSILCFLLVIILSGCATVPRREVLPTYNLDGVTYLSLISLCDSRNVTWEYDTFTRRFSLGKGQDRINLMVGDRLALVNDQVKTLNHPVDIYQGAVVVPYQFKKEIFDPLFGEPLVSPQRPLLPKIKKIVIDAGHGGNDPGAIGKTGLREKQITLDIAKRLNKLLRESGIETVMTRTTDRFIPLSLRADIANNSAADLFISIHANANRVKGLNGFEIYYISPYTDDYKRAMYAARHAHLNIENSCFSSQSDVLKAILWDMIYNYNRGQSIKLARSICRNIGSALDTRILGIKAANFYVLKGANMPAVLIEVGFISNPQEESRLKNSYYRQQITEAIAEGIDSYSRNLSFAEASS